MSFDIEKLREMLDPSDAIELMSTFRLKRVGKDEIYNPPGEVFRKVFYVVKGMLRSYVVTESGEEKTLFFRWEGHFGGAYESLHRNEPTKRRACVDDAKHEICRWRIHHQASQPGHDEQTTNRRAPFA